MKLESADQGASSINVSAGHVFRAITVGEQRGCFALNYSRQQVAVDGDDRQTAESVLAPLVPALTSSVLLFWMDTAAN